MQEGGKLEIEKRRFNGVKKVFLDDKKKKISHWKMVWHIKGSINKDSANILYDFKLKKKDNITSKFQICNENLFSQPIVMVCRARD